MKSYITLLSGSVSGHMIHRLAEDVNDATFWNLQFFIIFLYIFRYCTHDHENCKTIKGIVRN